MQVVIKHPITSVNITVECSVCSPDPSVGIFDYWVEDLNVPTMTDEEIEEHYDYLEQEVINEVLRSMPEPDYDDYCDAIDSKYYY